MNVMTVDVEDWYQTTLMEQVFNRNCWDKLPQRYEYSTHLILDIFAQFNVKATFFILGWIAQRTPKLVKEIYKRGHEIASHGYFHQLVYTLSPKEFEKDLTKSIKILEDIIGNRIKGYIAPSFSVNKNCLWFFDILAQNGIEYDCSIFPLSFHPTYGWRNAPDHPFILKTEKGNTLVEFPGSTFKFLGLRIPFAGGAYFRIYPYEVVRCIMKLKQYRKEDVIFYLHPWEFDTKVPKVKKLSLFNKWRTYFNLDKTQVKLKKMIREFSFLKFEDFIKNKKLPVFLLKATGEFVRNEN